MTHAIRFQKTGGPEVLVWEEVQVGKPGPWAAREPAWCWKWGPASPI
jgi:hypothetical protein